MALQCQHIVMPSGIIAMADTAYAFVAIVRECIVLVDVTVGRTDGGID